MKDEVIDVTPVPDLDYASFTRRFVARLIDSLIVAIPAAMVHSQLSFVGALFLLIYYPVFEGSAAQATPGKRFMGIKVTDRFGHRLTVRASLIRFFMSLVSFIVLCGGGALTYFFTKRKQALHDLIAETVVVNGKNEAEGLWESWAEQLKLWFRAV